MHYVGDVAPLLSLRRWKRAFLWPPCTQQTLSDKTHSHSKRRDGRMLWGIAFFLRCLCTDADCVVVEQPDTVIPDYTGVRATTRL
eukprot:4313613-Pleurochrysis_carterae.AAC.1